MILRELEDLVKSITEYPQAPLPPKAPGRIIVLRNYRFHKKLSIELYAASYTSDGRLKNPLTLIDPLAQALGSDTADELRFLTAVARFQNQPTTPGNADDLQALKFIIQYTAKEKLYEHNPSFSEKIVAGSLDEVKWGKPVHEMNLIVNRQDEFYTLLPQIVLQEQVYGLDQVQLKYDHFIFHGGRMHLVSQLPLLKILKFFSRYAGGLRLHQSKFDSFEKATLRPLTQYVSAIHSYAAPAGVELGEDRLERAEQLIYLSELGNYILLNPVVKYDEFEVPLLSNRPVYTKDKHGTLLLLQRDDRLETSFLALLLKQHHSFAASLQDDLPYFYLTRSEFLEERWFLDAFEQWQAAGIAVLGFNELRDNKVNGNKPRIHINVKSGIDWFNAVIDMRYGKSKAKLKDLRQAVSNNSRYVKLDDGTQGIIPDEWLKKFRDYFEAGDLQDEEIQVPKFRFYDLKKLFGEEALEPEVQEEVRYLGERLIDKSALPEARPPATLKASLRHYQRQGLSWLLYLDGKNMGGCLADDMGLGKTIQIIALLLMQKERGNYGPSLVVMPTSLLFNWEAELKKFAPSLKVLLLYGWDRLQAMQGMDNYDVVLTTYGSLLGDISFLRKKQFNLVVLDESQQIKNIDSQRYEAVNALRSRNRFILTGTPVENNTRDLYAQLSFACPGLLGSKRSFRDLFAIPIDKFKSSRNARELQQRVAPFILRRLKEDVLRELPPKTEIVLHCPMNEEQRKVYDDEVKEFRDYIEGKTDEAVMRTDIHILKSLTRLRQVCDSPLLLKEEKTYTSRSSKIEVLMEQLELRSANHKILVFSQFVSMLELIKKELDEKGMPCCILTGSTKDREAVVREFEEREEVRVFLISLKAGGTGLNLARADYVFIVDPWWNPAVENQAIDRAYRIGQDKKVVAVRLVCPGTIEEKMLQLQQGKRELSDQLVRTDAAFTASFTREDWNYLLQDSPGSR